MKRTDAIITICKEYQREPTRRSWQAVSKALTALDATDEERIEMEKRMGYRKQDGEFYDAVSNPPKPVKKIRLW